MGGQIHIVGAGLAGLAAAVRLADDGRQVTLYEAAPQAGGRARSYHDKQLDCLIDNGNHLLLSANWAALSYLKTIASRDALIEIKPARLPFYDLQSGATWLIKPSLAMPFRAADRPPGTSARDFLSLGLALPGQKTVAQAIKGRGAAWKNFWQPMTVAALNTQPEEASAKLLARIVRETFLKGESHCRPLIAREGLGPAFIDPALAFLKKRGATINLGWRLKDLRRERGRATQLSFDKADIAVGEGDHVILALPPWNLSDFLPKPALPFQPRPIVNAHIKLDQALSLPGGLPLLGLLGGTAEWIFQRGPILSLTVSAAEALLEEPKADLTERLWQDTAKALGLPPSPQPPIRLLVEKRATFAATPQAERHRPGPGALGPKLLLAGDWTATGLPSTIEGAIRSGYAAAQIITSS